ncbi:GNAT family N-acetyltransferase [Enterococcus olivae]
MLHNIEFRPYKNSYCQEIINLFVDTVMNIKDYSPIQITAWIGHPTVSDWHPRFVNSDTIVAIYQNQIVGFGNLVDEGLIDMLFIHKDFQREGMGSRILQMLETEARKNGSQKLLADVSITAVSLFQSRGFDIIEERYPVRNSVQLRNYKMLKVLT